MHPESGSSDLPLSHGTAGGQYLGGGLSKLPGGTKQPCPLLPSPWNFRLFYGYPESVVHLSLTSQTIDVGTEVNKDGTQDLGKSVPCIFFPSPLILLLALSLLYKANSKRGTPRFLCPLREQSPPIIETRNFLLFVLLKLCYLNMTLKLCAVAVS